MENVKNQLLPEVEKKIIVVRGQQVILDADVAELYGVQTKRINEAVSNNPEKFPEGYVIVLDNQEKTEVVENFDHLQSLRFSPQLPKAFTEKGLYMLATILKSQQAVQTTIAIVEAYAKLRELSRVVAEISKHQNDEAAQKSLVQRGSELVEELMADAFPKQSSETTIELNLAMLKVRHTVRKEKSDG